MEPLRLDRPCFRITLTFTDKYAQRTGQHIDSVVTNIFNIEHAMNLLKEKGKEYGLYQDLKKHDIIGFRVSKHREE